MTIESVFIYALFIMLGITFIVSILFTFRSGNPRYLRLFPFYHGISIVTEIIVHEFFSIKETFSTTNTIPYNIFTFIEFSLYSGVIFSVVRSGRKVIAFCMAFFFFFFFVQAIKHNLMFPTGRGLLLQNISLIIPCLVYYNDIFSAFSIPNLSKEPSFWIVTGVMFYLIITTPLLFFPFQGKSSSDTYGTLYFSSNGTAYILMYLLLIKAYTCRIGR
jgi:hypothetical protein